MLSVYKQLLLMHMKICFIENNWTMLVLTLPVCMSENNITYPKKMSPKLCQMKTKNGIKYIMTADHKSSTSLVQLFYKRWAIKYTPLSNCNNSFVKADVFARGEVLCCEMEQRALFAVKWQLSSAFVLMDRDKFTFSDKFSLLHALIIKKTIILRSSLNFLPRAISQFAGVNKKAHMHTLLFPSDEVFLLDSIYANIWLETE